jgi:hypothetical protein
MTDLKDQLDALCADEPPMPHDLDRVVVLGQRAVRRRRVWAGTAATVGVAGVTAAIILPFAMDSGPDQVTVGGQPKPTAPTATEHCKLYFVRGGHNVQQALATFRKRHAGGTVRRVHSGHDAKVLELCPPGAAPAGDVTGGSEGAAVPAGPPYHYTEAPEAIAARLGDHLDKRVNGFDLTIVYTRPFAQESSTLDHGRPTYFGGNVDVRESDGYGDIGVQVTHEVTEQVPFTGPCESASGCEQTTLPDGSVLRTDRVHAGPGSVLLTAEVHRPDGVVVAAQESNYAFGPDAGSEPHGSQPLSLDKLTSLAEDAAFTF